MINNERGNSLITVLLVSLVFTVLGMAIVASSISGAKKTATRESDISITYESIQLIDKMTSDLAVLLNGFPLESYRSKGIDNKIQVTSSFDSELQKKLIEDLLSPNKDNSQLACVNIIDLSSTAPRYIDDTNQCVGNLADYDHFEIEKDKDFTRVFDIVLVTKNPVETEGKISRTISKRLILSPLPSFLKYAAGSDDKLVLNGSPNFQGNIYANNLEINEKAQYSLRDDTEKEISTPKSSINGDLYSQTANLLTILDEKNFYKGKVPQLKHDSQFINIEFDNSMNEQINVALANSSLSTERKNEGSSFSIDLAEEISTLVETTMKINICNNPNEAEEEGLASSTFSNIPSSEEENCINSDIEKFTSSDPVKLKGNTLIMSTNFPIELNDLFVDGDLYLVSNEDITINGHIYVSGKTHLINFGGKLQLHDKLISADSITAESHVVNKDDMNSLGLKFNGDIIGGKDVYIKPIDSTIEMNRNIFANQSFQIEGDDEFDEIAENDQVIFDSVVYAGKNAYISNANILGADNNNKQLILLAKEELFITRINEFNNFHSLDEGEPPYLPLNDYNIKPLKGFFYTEDTATLYGVGSLFFIEGGVFAKKELKINAVRGKVNDVSNMNHLTQDGKYSRFIVDYNQDVLLKRIEALPIMNQLQIFSDELIIK